MYEERPTIENKEQSVPRMEVVRGESPDDIEPLWVDFDYGDDEENGIKSPGFQTYVISPVTERDLFADKYINCTGVVGIGKEKNSGKQRAFISHQNPQYFLHGGSDATELFVQDLKVTLTELLNQSDQETLEFGLFGGNDDSEDGESQKNIDYTESITLLTRIITECTGITPVILNDANHEEGAVDVTILTQERKVFISS